MTQEQSRYLALHSFCTAQEFSFEWSRCRILSHTLKLPGTTLFSIMNSTVGKYCFYLNGHTLGLHLQTRTF